MTEILLSLLATRVRVSLVALLLGATLVAGCGFHYGNKWGSSSRPSILRPLDRHPSNPANPTPDDDDRRRRPLFRDDGTPIDPAAEPEAAPAAPDSAAEPDASTISGLDRSIRYDDNGQRLLNHSAAW
jgi:hypothetical protein